MGGIAHVGLFLGLSSYGIFGQDDYLIPSRSDDLMSEPLWAEREEVFCLLELIERSQESKLFSNE